MDELFLWRLLLSFFIGGLWIAGTTIIADRVGSKIGGFIGGLPSTVVLSYFFIALTQGESFAIEATNIFPLAQANTGFFLVVYVLGKYTGFRSNLFLSVVVWLSITSFLLYYSFSDFMLGSVIFILFYVITYVYFRSRKDTKHVSSKNKKLSLKTVVFRFLLGGTVIALAVIMSELGGPTYGGVFSSFPAMFFSTVLLTYLSQGKEFSRNIAVSLFSAGMLSVFVYVLGVRMFFGEYGMWRGSVFAYILAICATYIFYIATQKT